MTDEFMEVVTHRCLKLPVPDFKKEMKSVYKCIEGFDHTDDIRGVDMSLDALSKALKEVDEKRDNGESYQRTILKVLWDVDILSRLTGYRTAYNELMENEIKYTTEKQWSDTYLAAMRFCEITMMANEGACNVRDKYYACQMMHYIEINHPDCVPTEAEKEGFRHGPDMLRNIVL